MSATPILELLTVLDTQQPLSLGQVKLNADGILELNHAPPLQRANFVWMGAPVRISLHNPKDDKIICDIVADLGALPFSAQNAEHRNMLLAILQGFRAPPDCRLLLGPRQAIWACQQTALVLPLTPAAILAEVTIFLRHMGPPMNLIKDIQNAYDGRQRAAP